MKIHELINESNMVLNTPEDIVSLIKNNAVLGDGSSGLIVIPDIPPNTTNPQLEQLYEVSLTPNELAIYYEISSVGGLGVLFEDHDDVGFYEDKLPIHPETYTWKEWVVELEKHVSRYLTPDDFSDD